MLAKFIESVVKKCVWIESGGLGVRKINEFNLELLGKWCREGCGLKLWRQSMVLRVFQIRRGGILSYVWWKDIYDIFEGVGGAGSDWFSEGVGQELVMERVHLFRETLG